MKLVTLLAIILCFQSCKQNKPFDLAIVDANIFDALTGTIIQNKTILIRADTIANIIDRSEIFSAKKTINADGKLVTPGMIDTHIHLTFVFGDYEKAPLSISGDTSKYYREKLTSTYLPHGITTAMIMGQPEKWLEPTLFWMNNSSPEHIDIYTTGGALISKEDRKTYLNHVSVETPVLAKQKIEEYHNLGIEHIKLYWRLRQLEFKTAYKTADSLGMKIFGHIDNYVMFMDSTLKIGLTNYEHIFSISSSIIISQNELNEFYHNYFDNYDKTQSTFHIYQLELLRYLDENKTAELNVLIDRLAENKATFSTAIHLFAEKFGMTYYSDSFASNLSESQTARCIENIKILMKYAKKMHDKGINIRIGTDCEHGGKAFQSEQLLLYEHGFSVSDILKISTINGAIDLNMEEKYGSVTIGKKANLIIYNQNPFEDYKNFLSKKLVIKDGVEYSPPQSLNFTKQ